VTPEEEAASAETGMSSVASVLAVARMGCAQNLRDMKMKIPPHPLRR
jgi:hypothetical protein